MTSQTSGPPPAAAEEGETTRIRLTVEVPTAAWADAYGVPLEQVPTDVVNWLGAALRHGPDVPLVMTVEEAPGRLLTTREAAEFAGVTPGTWRGYLTPRNGRTYAPEPDIVDDFGHPRWLEKTLRDWLAKRPGRGTRTDLTTHTS